MNIKLGIAPIAWTNDDMPELGAENSFEQCISEMALSGFVGTEIGSKYPREPEVLREYLDIRGLSVASAWFSAFLTTEGYSGTEAAFVKHRDFLHAMGADVIVVSEQGRSIQGQMDVPVFEGKPIFNELEWILCIEGLNKLGGLAAEKGMCLVYHHHMGTGIQTGEEIDRLMRDSDPDRVSLLLDTGHLFFSGEDPLEIYKKYSSRIRHIHFKDIRAEELEAVKSQNRSFLSAVKHGTFTVPGDGIIDFNPIWNEIKSSGYSGWIIVEAEQDPAKANPFKYAIKARKYIREITGL